MIASGSRRCGCGALSGARGAGGRRGGSAVSSQRRSQRRTRATRAAQAHGERRGAQPWIPPASPVWVTRLQKKIPGEARQVVAVYGEGRNSADATVALYTKQGEKLAPDRQLGRAQRQEGLDPRPPRGRQAQPGRSLHAHRRGRRASRTGRQAAVHQQRGLQPRLRTGPRRPGTTSTTSSPSTTTGPRAPRRSTRPAREGQSKGGSIWLHMDHGSGTSGCVSISRSGMQYLLRTSIRTGTRWW